MTVILLLFFEPMKMHNSSILARSTLVGKGPKSRKYAELQHLRGELGCESLSTMENGQFDDGGTIMD